MIGIDPSDVPILRRAPAVDSASAERRFRAAAPNWVWDHYGDNRNPPRDYFAWERDWHRIPHDLLANTYTRDELVRLWHDSVLASELDDHFQEHETLIWKVQHSLWRYSCARDLARFLALHNGLGRLTVDLPDFDVRLTHTRSINTAGWAEHGRNDPIYLDGSFGVLLHHRGKHVMTIGIALSRQGVLVAQVQLRQKLGNRFLYKLPMPCLDFALDLLGRAFPDEVLHLVTGNSTTAAVRAAHGKRADVFTAEIAARVARFYDQPLRNYVRTGDTIRGTSDDGRVFSRLIPARVQEESAA